MQDNVGLIVTVTIPWLCNIQTSIAVDSTDVETKAIFHVSIADGQFIYLNFKILSS